MSPGHANWRFREPRSLCPIVWDGDTIQILRSFHRRVVGPKAFEPWSESLRRNDLWCAFSATGAGVTPSRHRPRLTRCAALQCAGNNPRIHCLRPLNSCLPSAGCRTGAPTGQLATGRPNRWHDRFTLNIGLDRNDTIMSATCKKETFPCRVPQKAFPEPPWSDRVATI